MSSRFYIYRPNPQRRGDSKPINYTLVEDKGFPSKGEAETWYWSEMLPWKSKPDYTNAQAEAYMKRLIFLRLSDQVKPPNVLETA